MRFSFANLAEIIARPTHVLKAKARLQIPDSPDPFVPPELRVMGTDLKALEAEVVYVEAPAAVGKSTMARALSARTGAPFLDLAQVPVSTQSLVGLLQSDFSGPGSPVAAFHKGEIPLIVDALDEGRLLSGEQSFERFLETTGELLMESRMVTSRPKVVFLGRPEAIGLTKVGLQIADAAFTSASVDVDFFGEDGARRLIEAYASAAALPDAAYWSHPVPVRELVDAYFESIESALDLPKDSLWFSDRGRAFAGYAPVLAALGVMIAKFDNFIDVRNQLRDAKGAKRAWAVIESVLELILQREQAKLTDQLKKRISISVPLEAYDAYEQLTLLTQLIHRQSVRGSGRVRLAAADQTTYERMVEQYLYEHPFVRQGEPANPVLGSLILAHALYNDLLRSADLTLLGNMSRQPFLWRSLSGKLEMQPTLLDGRYVGFVLNSFWNDPVRSGTHVAIRSTANDSALVFVPSERHRTLSIEVAPPVWLYGQVFDCNIDIDGDLEMHGQTFGKAGDAFVVRGLVEIICAHLKVETEIVRLEGRTWLEADRVTSRPKLNFHLKGGGEVGLGGVLRVTYPWKQLSSTIEPPYSTPPVDTLEALIDECWRRLPAGVTITLSTGYSNPGDDRLRWTDRQFPHSFPKLIELMRRHGLALVEKMSAADQQKVRVRFSGSWEELRRTIRGEDVGAVYTGFIRAAREAIQ